MRGNQEIKRCKYLAFTFQTGSYNSIMLRNGAIPRQHIDAPEELPHSEVESPRIRPLCQTKK